MTRTPRSKRKRKEPRSGTGLDARGRRTPPVRTLVLGALVVAVAVVALFLWRRGAGDPPPRNPATAPSPVEPEGASIPAPPAPAILGTKRPIPDTPIAAEFLRVAERLRGNSEYVGTSQLERYFAHLRVPGLRADAKRETRRAIVSLLVLHGRLDEAEEELDALLRTVEANPGLLRQEPELLQLAALVHLRRAEVENCIRRHDKDCCLFPLAAGGLHSQRRPAERARELYLRYLDMRPDDLKVRWLLNVSNMALGEYPRAVPQQWRIQPEAFASEHDLGRFVDVAPVLGVDDLTLCGGVVANDMDGDGWLDIVTSSFDPDTALAYFRATGDGSFEDLSAGSGLDDQLGGLNLLGADYDSDGDVDLLVLRGAWLHEDGRIRNSLLRNDGTGHFLDVTREAGLGGETDPTQAATWGDFDNDGDLDLFVGVETSGPRLNGTFEGLQARFYLNQGDGTFRESAESAGLASKAFCKGVTAGDYDNDGDLDLYLSNIGPNQLFRNEGDGTFRDVGADLGVQEPVGRSFAPWFFDYDNDGWLDLFVGNYSAKVADVAADALGLPYPASGARLYHNEGGSFREVGVEAGLDHPWLPMGANFGDFDSDGFLDIYLATGEPSIDAIVPNVALWNDGKGHFLNVTTSAGLGHLQKGHGVAFADFDHDGDQDIYNQLGGFYPGDVFHNALFRNPGQGNRFLFLKLVGRTSVANGYGARVRAVVRTPDGEREIHRAVGSVSSFGGSPERQEIGLGSATELALLEIRWPASGLVQRFEKLPLDRLVTVTEGEDQPVVKELIPVQMGLPGPN